MSYPCDKSFPAEQPLSELACAYIYTDVPIFKHGVHGEPREQKARPSQPSLPPSSVSQWLPEHLPGSGTSPTEPENALPGELAPLHICGPFLPGPGYRTKAPSCYVRCPFPADKMTAPKLLVVRLPNFQAPGELDQSTARPKNTIPSSPVGTHRKTSKPSRHTGQNREKGCTTGLQVTNQNPISSADALRALLMEGF